SCSDTSSFSLMGKAVSSQIKHLTFFMDHNYMKWDLLVSSILPKESTIRIF
ncbi:hypothetical protein L9F63_000431, partial [Diploptera punctata]